MNVWQFRPCRAFLTIIASTLVSLSTPVLADNPPVDLRDNVTTLRVYGDWRVDCPPISDAKQFCRMEEDVLKAEDRSEIMRLTIYSSGESDILEVRFAIPAVAAPGMALNFGSPGEKSHVFAFESCDESQCFARISFTGEFSVRFAHASAPSVRFQPHPEAGPVGAPYSMKGFEKAFAAYKRFQALHITADAAAIREFVTSDPDLPTRRTYGDWMLACKSAIEQESRCLIFSNGVKANGTNEQVQLGVSIIHGVETLTVIVPHNVRLDAGVEFELGRSIRRAYPIDICIDSGCIARVPFVQAFENEFATAPTPRIVVKTATGDRPALVLSYSILGFERAYDAMHRFNATPG